MSCGSILIVPSEYATPIGCIHCSRFVSYGAAMVGVATAKTPCGPYTYKSSFKPLGADSRDESIFQDGMCYLTILNSNMTMLTLIGFR